MKCLIFYTYNQQTKRLRVTIFIANLIIPHTSTTKNYPVSVIATFFTWKQNFHWIDKMTKKSTFEMFWMVGFYGDTV